MKGLLPGIFLGVGIGFLTAPRSGVETRRILSERWQELRGSELLKQYLPAFSSDLHQARSGLSDLAQFAFSKVKANDVALSDLARLTVEKMMSYRISLNGVAGFATTMRKRAS
jgi:gas vesicle protein